MDRHHEAVEGHVTDTPRIVLFGMHGQVGKRLMETLSDAGYEVTGIDRARCNFESATAKDIAVIIRAVEPALVINAAAYTAVDNAQVEQALATRINADVVQMIAIAAQDQGVPFVHFSTDYVFDGLRGAPYRETSETHPTCHYGASKRAGEEAVLQQGGYVFRLQWVFDATGKNFFLTMRKLAAERALLRVVADQLGAPSNALHIARAVTQAAPMIVAGSLPAGIYHLTAGGFTSWHGFACAIVAATSSNAQVEPLVSAEYPVPATRPKDARLDCAALAAHGIAMPHWHAGLTQAIKDLHAH